MTTNFEDAIARIEDKYRELDYKLGWRFLNCSKAVLDNQPEIALVTANPGGNSPQPDHPSTSCENGHSYLTEQWGTSQPGKSPLQVQLQSLFIAIAQTAGKEEGGRALLEKSLAGYFIPFRSPRLSDLPHPKEARAFAINLWSGILASSLPKVLICIDRDTYKAFGKIVPAVYGIAATAERSFETGWGKYQADVTVFGNTERTLLRLPHLSTFKLFGRPQCKPYLDTILTAACAPIMSPTAKAGLWD